MLIRSYSRVMVVSSATTRNRGSARSAARASVLSFPPLHASTTSIMASPRDGSRVVGNRPALADTGIRELKVGLPPLTTIHLALPHHPGAPRQPMRRRRPQHPRPRYLAGRDSAYL